MLKYFSRTTGWIVSIVIALFLARYLLLSSMEDEEGHLYQSMMFMSTAAFQEAVNFSHMRYHASNKKGYQIDLIELNGKLMDFNEEGFPTGFEQSETSIRLPISTNECRQLWISLLGSFRPLIEPEENAHLVVKAFKGQCIFALKYRQSHRIVYNPKTGRVKYQVI